MQVALQTNAELLQLPDKYEASDSAAILAQVSADLISPAESTRLEALHWVSLTLPPPWHNLTLLDTVVAFVLLTCTSGCLDLGWSIVNGNCQ